MVTEQRHPDRVSGSYSSQVKNNRHPELVSGSYSPDGENSKMLKQVQHDGKARELRC